ncbi:titin homolog isoform X3 [Alosa sapidissima]|uniref:titin homolog isoform X3 n=1 Tax=Alosa sapidissima TaxID=34773 RepID=UPI001C0A0107|nr:titin homolog isoform X3 [Alosa sapidissima]
MKAVKKIFRKDNPESDVDTSGSDPEGSDINTSNPKTDMTLHFQNNSPAEQMIATATDSAPDPEISIALVSPLKPDPESLSESAPKSTTIRKNTPSPQPIKALQGLFSKLRPRSGVSSESDAQCFVEDPVDQSSEKVAQPDGEISQVTYTQEQSDSCIKSDCHEEMTPEIYADYAEASREAMGVSTDTMEQQKTEEASSKSKGFLKLPYISTGSEDILQNGPGASDQENTSDEISREPLEIKMNVCATIKRNILPSILCGSSKTGPGPEQEGKIQGKIKNFVRSTLGKKEPQKTTRTSAKTSQTETHPSPALVDDKGGNTEDELSKTLALKAGSDRTQVRRHVSKEAVRKKPHHPMQQPSNTKTRELPSKPQSVNVGDSHKDQSASVPPVGPAEHRNKRHSVTQSQSTRRNTRHSVTRSQSTRRNTRHPAQESSAGIHTTRDTSKHAFESRTEPSGKPHPSVASNRAQAKDINKQTQQDRETQESNRATTRKSTTIEKTERTYPPTASGTVTNRRQKSVSSDTTTNQSQPSRSESRKERNAGSTEIPLRKPSISDRAQSMESTKRRNSTFNAAQAHKPVKKPSKDQTNHSSSRRKTSTAEEGHSSTQRSAADSMVQSPAVQDKGQKLRQEDSGRVKDNERRRSSAGKTKPAPADQDTAGKTKPAPADQDTAGKTKPAPADQDTAGKTKPAPADQDTAEAKAQGPSSKKKPASASAKNQNQHAEDLATVVPDNRQVGLRGSKERNTMLCSKTTDTKTTESCQHQNMINNKTIESEDMEEQQEILNLVAPQMPTVTRLTCCIDKKENQEPVIVINTNDLERDVEHAKDGGVFVSDESPKVAQIKEHDQKRFQQPDERTSMILNKIAQVEPSESQRTKVEECSEGHSKELHPPEDSNRVEERNKKSTYMQDDVAQGGYHKPISLEPYEHQKSICFNNRKIDNPEEQLENLRPGQAQSESKAQMESPKSPSLTCSSDQSHQVLDSDTDHVEHPAEIPLVDGPEEPLIETQTKVSIPEKLTTDPADLITVTNLSFTWDTDSITKNPEEIQLVYNNTDDDVSIPEQLTDPADLSSSPDTEDSQTKQAEFQLVDRADDDVSIPEQLSTDPADFITVSDLSTVGTEDIPTKPEEIQLVQDSVDDDVSLSEKFTTDPTVIGTDLSSTVDREDIQIKPEEIQLIQDAVDDDVSIAQQLTTDSTDFITVTNCSSTLDTEDMNTNQEEIQLIEESADDDVSIPEQFTTDPASFIIVTDHSSPIETNDINTKPEEIQRVQDSVDDHEGSQGTQDKYSMINSEHAQTDLPKPAQEPEIVEAEDSLNEDSLVTPEDQLGLEKYNVIQNEVSQDRMQSPLTTKSRRVQFTDSIRIGTKSMKDLHEDQEDISKRRPTSFHDQKQNQTTFIPCKLPAVTCSLATSSAAQVKSLALIQPSKRAKGLHGMSTEKKPGLLDQNQSPVIACYRIDHTVDPTLAAQEFSYSSAGFNTTTVLRSFQEVHVKLQRGKKRNGMELSKAVQGKTLKPIQQSQKAQPKDSSRRNSSKKSTSITEDRPKRSYQPIEDNKRSKLVQSEVFQHGSNMCVHSESPDEQPTDTNGMKESKTMKNQQGMPKPVPVNLRRIKVKPSMERITTLDDKKEEREPVIISNTGDLYSGIDHAKDLDTVTPSEPLTEAQMNGFRAIFDLFTKDDTGFISTTGFTTTLNTIGITLKPADIRLALKKAGCNEPEDITVTVFYKAITKMLDSGMLPVSTRDEILKYYHNKTQRLIHRAGRPRDAGGHVLTYYSKVAHLLGLSRHQLLNYIKPAAETDQRNPYLQKPCLSSTNPTSTP